MTRLSVLLMSLLAACARAPEPPTVTLRDIANMERIAEGELIAFTETTSLFVPTAWTAPADGAVTLTAHFHDAAWFAHEEHARRGATNPIFVFGGLQGSSAYREPYLDREHFGRQLRHIEQALRERGARANTHIAEVEIQSFSAGYGAVREIIKVPAYVDLIDRIVLADSMYASYRSDTDRRPEPEHIQPWIDYARLALAGEKVFVAAHASGRSPGYAATTECAHAVLAALGLEEEPVPPDSVASAALGNEYRLISRFDRAGLHFWGYAGDTPEAHMAVARTLADIWLVVDAETPSN